MPGKGLTGLGRLSAVFPEASCWECTLKDSISEQTFLSFGSRAPTILMG